MRSALASLALHTALLVGVFARRSCAVDVVPPVASATDGGGTIEVAALSPPREPVMARADDRDLDTHGASERRHPAARRTEASAVERPPLAESPRGRETAGSPAADAITGPSTVTVRPQQGTGNPGPGTGAGDGRGGPGAGGGGPPTVSGGFAFGSGSRGRFKGVACFFAPGILRIADVRDCVPAATFYTNTFNVHERQQPEGFPGVSARSSWFMIEYTGVFSVATDGNYEFRLHSDDGSFLLIDGSLVIDNDGKHQPESRRASIRLIGGDHHLQLLYAQTTDRMALQLYVRPPGSNDERLFAPSF